MLNVDSLAVEFDYETAAQEYYATLPMEHFMESVTHSTQKQITLCSLKLLQKARSDVHVFSELLIQYFYENQLRRAVPDSMVVVCDEAPKPSGSYNLALEPAAPFLVIEYVSSAYHEKDYETNLRKYKQELRVPYYLLFNANTLVLDFFHLENDEYVPIEPNSLGRRGIPELNLELAVVHGWIRFWHLGVLLALPEELDDLVKLKERQLRERDDSLVRKDQMIAKSKQALEESKQALLEKDREIEALRARLAQLEKG